MSKTVAVRSGGQIIKVKNPLNPERIRTGEVLSWSYGRPRARMDDNHEVRYFPPDWVTVIKEAPEPEVSVLVVDPEASISVDQEPTPDDEYDDEDSA